MTTINRILLFSLLFVFAACASNKSLEKRSVATNLNGERVPVTITPDGERIYISDEDYTLPIMKGDYRVHIQNAKTRGSAAGCNNLFIIADYTITKEKEIENIRFVHTGPEICNKIVIDSISRIEIIQPAISRNKPVPSEWRSLFIFDPITVETRDKMKIFLQNNRVITLPTAN